MMEEKLAEFQAEVDRLLGNSSSVGGGGGGGGDNGGVTKTTLEAYHLAQSQSEDYVQGPKLRIMFLRAETFNAPLAAQRMMIYLEEKLSRFGPKALTRGLTLKDLSPQSREMIVDMGIHQLLPVRDSAGRAIYAIHQDNRPRHLLIEDPMGAVRPSCRRLTSNQLSYLDGYYRSLLEWYGAGTHNISYPMFVCLFTSLLVHYE